MKAYEIIKKINATAAAEGRKKIINPEAYFAGSNEGRIEYDYTAEEKAEIAAAKEAETKEAEAKTAEAKVKRAAAKAKKEAADLAMGITPEKRKAMTNSRRYEREIEKLRKELAELEAKKAYWDAKC